MTALAANAQRLNKGSEGITAYQVAEDTRIFKGALVQLDAAGYAEPAARSASLPCVGVAMEEADNRDGANGAISVRVVPLGSFKFAKQGSITIANLGASLYVYDDNTLCLVGDADAENFVGTLEALEGSEVWVRLLCGQDR